MGYTSTSSLSSSFRSTCFLVFFLFGSALSQSNLICPFDYFFHMGDGVFDIGNAVAIQPYGHRLPAAHSPYGMTTLGRATGRWCDGLTDIDLGGVNMGFTHPVPYLGGNATANNAIIFAVARSPVLDREFFAARGIRIPFHAVSLSTQMEWFRTHISSICSTPTDCANIMGSSIFFTGDVEGNDMALALISGKSIEEARSYVPAITQTQINAAREVIRMGTMRVIIPGNFPIGCFPYILSRFGTNDPTDYDALGCITEINDLIEYKNNDLQRAVTNLTQEFPNATIFYGDFYNAYLRLLRETNAGPNANMSMVTCCGIGGRYNYDSRRFCGRQGVTVCSNPSQHIHWDGIHLTEDANNRLGTILQEGALAALNCTV